MQDFGVSTTQLYTASSGANPGPEANRPRLLIVEDEMIVAAVLEDMADFLGYDVVGSAGTVSAAMRLAQSQDFDVALLDVELSGGERSIAIAQMLEARGIPYLFLSGYGDDAAGSGPSLSKPFVVTDLGEALGRLSRAARPH